VQESKYDAWYDGKSGPITYLTLNGQQHFSADGAVYCTR